MNEILNTLTNFTGGHWMVDLLIQSTVVLSVALLANFFLRRQSAARRYVLLLVAAVSLLVLLASSIFAPRWQVFDTAAPASPRAVETEFEVTVERKLVAGEAVLETGAESPETVAAEPPVVASSKLDPSAVVVGIWLLGAGLFVAKILVGALALRRVGGTGCGVEAERLLDHEACAMDISPRPKLLRLGEKAMPMTWGLRRHVIALPSGADAWPVERLRRVLRHELAHVARRDFATGCLASACLALLWFHPLAWCLRSALVCAREGACDDLALDGSPRPERDAYVRDLVEIIGAHQRARRCPGMAIALAMGSGRKRTIKRRLAAILDERRDRRATPRRMLWWGAPLWGAAAVGIGTLTTLPQVAAQKEPGAGSVPVGEPVKKTYSLVQAQLDSLMPKVSSQDPFAADPFSEPVASKPQPVDLDTAAASARYELVSRFGVPITAGDEVEIEFESRYKMAVTAPPHIQKSIAWVLDSLMGTKQVSLKLHVFEIVDPAWLEEQLGGASAPSKAHLIDRGAFLKLKRAIGEKAGKTNPMPSVMARSGQRVMFEDIQEFIYPTEYDPPELPASSNGDPTTNVPGGASVTPANPTAFDVRNVGMTWEVEPIVRADGSIEITTSIEDTQFNGFINYGSAINGIIREDGAEKAVTLTDNRILQPIFAVSRLNTSFVLASGKVVALHALAPRDERAVVGELEERDEPVGVGDAEPPSQKYTPAAVQVRKSYVYFIEAKVVEGEK
ncbi:MAG: M56 family metallopeptidase [Verrucomicrobiales bacterium]